MDSHQLFRYGVNSANLSYINSYFSVPSLPITLLGPFKFSLSNSPALSSPFLSHFESDSFTTTLGDSQDQRYSPNNLSRLSPYCNSSFEMSSINQIASSYLDHYEDESRQFYSGSNTFVYDGCLTENISYGLKQLESVLMGRIMRKL